MLSQAKILRMTRRGGRKATLNGKPISWERGVKLAVKTLGPGAQFRIGNGEVILVST